MQEIRKELNEEIYNKYARMRYTDLYNVLRPNVLNLWFFGYRYYGFYLSKDGKGKFYVVHMIGDSRNN